METSSQLVIFRKASVAVSYILPSLMQLIFCKNRRSGLSHIVAVIWHIPILSQMGAGYIKISQVVYLQLHTCNGPIPISFVDKLVINLFLRISSLLLEQLVNCCVWEKGVDPPEKIELRMTHITLQIHQIYAWILLEWPNHSLYCTFSRTPSF